MFSPKIKRWGLIGLTAVLGLWMGTKSYAEDKPAAPAAAVAAPAAAPVASPFPDATGTGTGGAGDVVAKTPGKPTLDEVATELGHSKIAINFVWTLVAGFLVMFMQAGFMLVETGFCRAKNASHTSYMNFTVYFIGLLGFYFCGFALMMGGSSPLATLGGTTVLDSAYTIQLFGKPFQLFGTKGFFLGADVLDVGVFSVFLFQMVFMDTACTIPTGAMAERWKTSHFILFTFFMAMFVYPVFGSWVWGGGWLSKLGTNFGLGHGHVDFAGSSVVHMVGGVAAFVGAWLIGPRIGKYGKDGKAVAIPGHDMPMAILGTMILAFGWFGFNAGSSLAGTDLRISVAAVNTMLASASGGMAGMLFMYFKTGKWDLGMTVNAFLAGLVAITAPCAFVTSGGAFIIGAVAGVLVIVAALFVENTLKIDDPVGAIAVHGVNGAWGVLSLGLFADGKYGDGWNGVAGPVKGLFYGDSGQFIAQIIGTLSCAIWVGLTFFIFMKVTGLFMDIRVSKEVELEGLDVEEIGAEAYPDFAKVKN
jgi:Amt family ammonium transporter